MRVYAPSLRVVNRILRNNSKETTMHTRVCPTCQGEGKVQLVDGSYQFCSPCLGAGVLYMTTETYNRVQETYNRSHQPTPTYSSPGQTADLHRSGRRT